MSDLCIFCNVFNGNRLVDCDECGITTCVDCIVKYAEILEGDHGVVHYCTECRDRVVHPIKYLAEEFFNRAGGQPMYFNRKTNEGVYERVIMTVRPHGIRYRVKVTKC